eukprot:gene8835-10449_t
MSINIQNSETVNFVVGGVYYSLLLSDIQAHQDCYFASVIKDEWLNSDQPIVISRDGVMFQHIFVYMYNSRYKLPFAVNGSQSLLVNVRCEADYYNLPELVAACDKTYEKELRKCTVTSGMLVYAKFSVAGDMFVGYRTIVPNAPAPNKDALVQAVASELIDCKVGVVLCLSTLYPIVAFDPSEPYLETDPDILTGRDAVLYEYLRGGFDITLVTVYVQRHESRTKAVYLALSRFKVTILRLFLLSMDFGCHSK